MLKHKQLPILVLLSLFFLSIFAQPPTPPRHFGFTIEVPDLDGIGTKRKVESPRFNLVNLSYANERKDSKFFVKVVKAAKKARNRKMATLQRDDLSSLSVASDRSSSSKTLDYDSSSPLLVKGQSSSSNPRDAQPSSSTPSSSDLQDRHLSFRYFFLKHFVEEGKNSEHRFIDDEKSFKEDKFLMFLAKNPENWKNSLSTLLHGFRTYFPNMLMKKQWDEIWTEAGCEPPKISDVSVEATQNPPP